MPYIFVEVIGSFVERISVIGMGYFYLHSMKIDNEILDDVLNNAEQLQSEMHEMMEKIITASGGKIDINAAQATYFILKISDLEKRLEYFEAIINVPLV